VESADSPRESAKRRERSRNVAKSRESRNLPESQPAWGSSGEAHLSGWWSGTASIRRPPVLQTADPRAVLSALVCLCQAEQGGSERHSMVHFVLSAPVFSSSFADWFANSGLLIVDPYPGSNLVAGAEIKTECWVLRGWPGRLDIKFGATCREFASAKPIDSCATRDRYRPSLRLSSITRKAALTRCFAR
jgi:hypothetical protein